MHVAEIPLIDIVYHGDTSDLRYHKVMVQVVERLAEQYPNSKIQVYITPKLPLEPLEWHVRVAGPTGLRNLFLSQRSFGGAVSIKQQ